MNTAARAIGESDVELITDYWLNATHEDLRNMGADPALLPDRSSWKAMLLQQIAAPLPEKKSYCLIWLLDGAPIGHCNINKIIFGEEAFMHLHIWKPDSRKAGIGTSLVRQSLPFFFRDLKLQVLYCEPYALNPAPNRTLAKAGFTWVREYVTIPGTINFKQRVNRWELIAAEFNKMEEAEEGRNNLSR